MTTYQHLPLSQGGVRLLQLLPDPDPHDPQKPIQCRLFEHALLTSTSIHPFEALSYVWGSDDKDYTILIDDFEFRIGANLHAALLHLRDRFIERYMWIDAICINQDDNLEKGHQVQKMAQIYATANRVIVWLGQASLNGFTDRGMEEIRLASAQKDDWPDDTSDDERAGLPEGVLDITVRGLSVVQEVAAARQILIKCGSAELDGYAFSVGVKSLGNRISQERKDLYSLVSSLNGLIRDAIIRPRQHRHDPSGIPFSLSVRPLSELLDIFRSRKATNTVDKVYALLGMSSNDPGTVGLSADYNASWDAVSENVVGFCLSNQVTSIETRCGLDAMVIKAKGIIVGSAAYIRCHSPGPVLPINDHNGHGHFFLYHYPDDPGTYALSFTGQQNILAATQEGDLICLFQGSSYPSIIRPHHDYWSIIIAAIRPSGGWYPDRFQSDDAAPYELLLVWDWCYATYE
ncbi:Heterokaryon incompatibility protein (HET) domain containing protein [Rhypophila sp. PSN 637]